MMEFWRREIAGRSQVLMTALLICVGAALGASACGKDKTKKRKSSGRDAIEHRGGIPIIPRGKVIRAGTKGAAYEVVIRAGVSASQALTFYRRQLQRDRWEQITDAKTEDGQPALSARRGPFRIVGAVRAMGKKGESVEIRFVKRMDKALQSVRPQVPKDVIVIATKIRWEGQMYGSGSRVELRGKSTAPVKEILEPILSLLRSRDWKVERRKGPRGQRILHAAKPKKRTLTYYFDATRTGSRVSLSLSPDEFAQPGSIKPGMKVAGGGKDAGAPKPNAENLVALPKDLVLWKGAEKVKGIRQGPLLMFSFDRPCKSPRKLGRTLSKRLRRQGYKKSVPVGLGAAMPSRTGPRLALTFIKRKKMVIVGIKQESDLCVVELTVKP